MPTDRPLNQQIIQVTPNEVIAAAEASDCQEATLVAALYQAIVATVVEVIDEHEPVEAVELIRDMFERMEQDDVPTLN